MHHLRTILPLALALGVGVAPVAFAQAERGETSQMSQQQRQGAMLPGGISVKGQLDHAYSEAVNAHESLALGMPDMAENHLKNVSLVLSHLESTDSKLSSTMKNRIAQVRQQADGIQATGDRAQALKSTQALVGRFVSFYDQLASVAPMGGGGGTARAVMSPSELVGSAAHSAAMAQAAIAGRNWEAATLHARDAELHLASAQREIGAMGVKSDSTEAQQIRQAHQEATQLSQAVSSHNASALKDSGKLVSRLGSLLPHVAQATGGMEMGGGGGNNQMQP